MGGAYAEKIVISQSAIAKKPSSINFVEAASLPIVGLTALEIYHRAQIKANETVLIVGASGGVGSVITPLAVKTGAKVLATAGSDKSAETIKTFGVSSENIINYSGLSVEQISEKVIALNGGSGVDVVIDLFGGQIKKACVESLGLLGRFLTIVEEPEQSKNIVALYPTHAPKSLFGVSATYHLVFVGAATFAGPKYWPIIGKELQELATLISEGGVKVQIYTARSYWRFLTAARTSNIV
jgi:NADPH:quinone reductase-like Zn-dependent oxidoreductase